MIKCCEIHPEVFDPKVSRTHPCFGGRRTSKVEHPHAYVEAMEAGQGVEAESESIARELEMGETMMLGLGLLEGGRCHAEPSRAPDRHHVFGGSCSRKPPKVTDRGKETRRALRPGADDLGRYGLGEMNRALDGAAAGRVVKALVNPSL